MTNIKRKHVFVLLLAIAVSACVKEKENLAEPTVEVSTTFIAPNASTISQSSTPTLFPITTHYPISENAPEIIVFTWDWPMKAGIPRIHIWKDGYSVWVNSLEGQYQVYETFLTTNEMLKIEEAVFNSNFWNYEDTGFSNPGHSGLNIWITQSTLEKNVALIDPNLGALVSSLDTLLNESLMKTEYIPQQAYISATRKDSYLKDEGFPWPDNKINFDFKNAETWSLIDGDTLSTAWNADRQGFDMITSQEIPYWYSFRIPGLTCLYNFDTYKYIWECNIYTGESP